MTESEIRRPPATEASTSTHTGKSRPLHPRFACHARQGLFDILRDGIPGGTDRSGFNRGLRRGAEEDEREKCGQAPWPSMRLLVRSTEGDGMSKGLRVSVPPRLVIATQVTASSRWTR
jgi:hypothetical protein